jgi:hypothetical protein
MKTYAKTKNDKSAGRNRYFSLLFFLNENNYLLIVAVCRFLEIIDRTTVTIEDPIIGHCLALKGSSA